MLATRVQTRPLGLSGLSRRPAARVVCQAVPEADKIAKQAAAAGVVATALLAANAAAPEVAVAARSGGRVGSNAGFAARRSGSSLSSTRTQATATTAAPASSRTTVVHHHTTVVAAPSPMFGGFGWGMPFGGFGWGGFAFRPAIIMPVPFLGGFLQFFFGILLAGLVFTLVKAAISSSKPKKSQDWDSL